MMRITAAILLWGIAAVGPAVAVSAETATGVVFDDANRNGRFDAAEKGLADVRVSNGRDVVKTDEDGCYTLTVDDDDIIFVVKPRNYMVPLNEWNQPQFYYIHKPAGSPEGLKYSGVSPTGPLPESVDFPLYHRPEPDRFEIIVFGDTQPYKIEEVHYLAHDILPALFGSDAAFGVTLGDVVGDVLTLFDPYLEVVSTVDVPWYNVHGNHDENYNVTSDEYADETWERVFGPATYSFDWGPVHFISLDSVHYDGDEERGRYHSEVGRYIRFIKNDLKHVPKDRLVVLMTHIPIVDARDKEELFQLLAEFPHTFSMSAHWHMTRHYFLSSDAGWPGKKPHHHWISPTTSGSWWSGAFDERGIPHTTMRDGTPNGYSIITFDGNDYRIRFKAARRPADEQMAIHTPSAVPAPRTGDTEVVVNVYTGSERSRVEMRLDGKGGWKKMKRDERPDPYYVAIKEAEKGDNPPLGPKMPRAEKSSHIWVANLPVDLPVGPHVIEVRSTDMFDQVDVEQRIVRVTPAESKPEAATTAAD